VESTRGLAASVEESRSADRLTVLARDGRVLFDAEASAGDRAFEGAGAAVAAGQGAAMGRFDATQWLSELHHVTEFATSRPDVAQPVMDVLIDLHEISLREVIPRLQVPSGGRFATAIEQRTAARLVALRRAAAPTETPRVDAPRPTPVSRRPERKGVSR
jgi:hypothetical protein